MTESFRTSNNVFVVSLSVNSTFQESRQVSLLLVLLLGSPLTDNEIVNRNNNRNDNNGDDGDDDGVMLIVMLILFREG
jgi:hypothetical protein